jgi:HK97 family phage prohead protease
MNRTFERRMAVAGLEMRDGADGFTLTGYASTFNQPYDMGWYTESVDPGAFTRTLGQNPDVRLLINHDGLPLARTTSGTLLLDTDSKGLRVQAQLDPTDPDVQALAPKMRRGDLNQMSFGFRTIEDSWSQDMSKRNMLSLDLNNGDASIVTYPANPTATVGLRSTRAAGPNAEAITAALRCLETRSATSEDIASVLTRALGYFTAVDLIVDTAQEQLAGALNIPNPDADAPDETTEPDEAAARAAAQLFEFRKRLSLSL